jgi:predicted metalloprotease with PDZ domain
VGTDKSAEIEQFIVKGEFLPLEKLNEALPAAFENQKVKTFNLGFTTDTGNFKKGSIVKDVHSDSPALAVGLRVGDKLAGISYVRDDVNFPCKIKVERDGEIQELSYLPAIEVLLPQLRSEGLWVKK